MNFRYDINGLRAIAVIAVVLFHFNPHLAPGGFAGVDVFFVISGFLMTGIILRGMENHTFSVLGFYAARANRIIPALVLLCGVLLIFGWFSLTPLDYQTLAKHAASSISFSSNFAYWLESGYFEATSNEKWLLHTWSLSVEWQFYLLYPLCLVGLSKFLSLNALKIGLIAGSLLGFLISIFATMVWPDSSYYLLPTRAWEMLFGGVAYAYPFVFKEAQKKYIAGVGITLIALSYIFISANTAWPGYLAILPVLGSYLVISANTQSSIITNNVISQAIGKWSYSIYLWHWPVAVYMKKNDLESMLMYFSLTILLGFISFHFVERSKWITGYKLLVVGIVPFLLSITIYDQKGIIERFPFLLITPEEISKERARYWVSGDKINPFTLNGKPKTVIIGNSHAIDLAFSLHENNYDHDIYYLATTHYCSIFGYVANAVDHQEKCKKISLTNSNNHHLKDADRVILHDDWRTLDLNAVLIAVDEIKSKLKPDAKIYIVGPKMQFYKNVNEIAVESFAAGELDVNKFSRQYQNKYVLDTNKALISFSKKQSEYIYIDALHAQCGAHLACDIVTDNGEFIYFDSNHFTVFGAKKLGKNLVPLIKN